jgi:hypothetical protein
MVGGERKHSPSIRNQPPLLHSSSRSLFDYTGWDTQLPDPFVCPILNTEPTYFPLNIKLEECSLLYECHLKQCLIMLVLLKSGGQSAVIKEHLRSTTSLALSFHFVQWTTSEIHISKELTNCTYLDFIIYTYHIWVSLILGLKSFCWVFSR